MCNRKLSWRLITLTVFFCLLCTGCSGKDANASSQESPNNIDTSAKASGTRDSTPVVLEPKADGTITYGNELATIDASHSEDGYVCIKYNGTNEKVKLLIESTGLEKRYQYTLQGNDYEVFPLTGGSGTYTFTVCENKGGEEYAIVTKVDAQFTIKDEFTPYLYPNQYVNYTSSTTAVDVGAQLAFTADSDLDVVAGVYNYLVDNITYDTEKAKSVIDKKLTFYLPAPDETLSSKTGICFDYAALMTTMLRTQGIPTRLNIGYAGTTYHSWISTYITDIGWVDKIIEFDGKSWTMMDPTFAASGKGSKESIEYITNSNNYQTYFLY